jgi:hypothetical protein
MAENRQPDIPLRRQDVPSPDPEDTHPAAFRPVGGTLTGDTIAVPAEDVQSVRAFLAVLRDNRTEARKIIGRMSLRDKALMVFFVRELSGVLEDAMDERLYAGS